MTDKELKEKVFKALADRKGEFALLRKSADTFVMNVLGDCKDVVAELKTAKDAVGLIIEIIDEQTNTGMFDPIDSVIAKLAFNRFDSEQLESWWTKTRAKILEA